MRPLQIIALAWLILIGAFFYGIKAAEHNFWPYPLIQDVEAFVAGHEEEQTELTEKVQNDLGLVPARHLVAIPELDHVDDRYTSLPVPVEDRREPPLVFLANDAPDGFRVIYGVFDFERHLHGAILIGPDGEVRNVWQISQEDLEWFHSPDANVFPHGFEITKDGSILVAYDHGTSLTRYDYCGNKVWRTKGDYHHSIDLREQDTFWVWGEAGEASHFHGNIMHRIRASDGTVLQSISIGDMIEANEDIDIFGIRQADSKAGSRWIEEGGGPFHQNDVDPLPAKLADAYPQFETGDLLISMRSINLIYVLDPITLDVKWWRQGLTRRQHDPEWNDRGTITIFDNNMHRGFSRIVELNPRTMESESIVNGKDYNFYSWHRGKHQELDAGHLLITSTSQGRVFEVAPDGTITFEFLNLYTPDKGALALSEARFLPVDYFEELPSCDT